MYKCDKREYDGAFSPLGSSSAAVTKKTPTDSDNMYSYRQQL